MRIAINTRFLIPDKMEGYGYFIYEVFERMARSHPEHQFYFLFDRPVANSFVFPDNVVVKVIKPPARHLLSWTVWYNLAVPLLLKKIKADVFVSPDGFCSLTTSVPQCLVVHDLAFLHYPDFIPALHLWYYKTFTPRFLKKAAKVVTVSAFSKRDLQERYQVPDEKVTVVFNAPHQLFQPISQEEREQVKQDYAGGVEYFIYTGTIHPRKNLIHLLKAFSAFKKRQQSNMKLLIVGRMAWKTNQFQQLLSTFKFKNDVVLTGYLPKEVLARVMAGAYALVYPSFFEGFGVPPLEAIQCGVPALVSNTSALPEIGGNAYLYFDPERPDEIAQKMMLIYKDEILRNKLIENGKQQLTRYSWDQSASRMWEVIMEMTASK
jgi:glycosyltransferase involved in cell wall biosynthesis